MEQYMKERTTSRIEWLGDMEPEYEAIVDWLCHMDDAPLNHQHKKQPVSWVVMANALNTRNGHRFRA